MIEAEQIFHSGAWTLSAVVSDGTGAWREWNTYYGYTKRDAMRMFRQHIKNKGWRIA